MLGYRTYHAKSGYRTFGPWEPPEFKLYRHEYYKHRRWLAALEVRISMTVSGMEFLGRVKRLGPMVYSAGSQ